MGEVNLTEFVGAVIIVLALSLLIRKGLFKVKRLNKKISTTVACLIASTIATLAAYPQIKNISIIYPIAGIIVWIWLFWELPLWKKNKAQ